MPIAAGANNLYFAKDTKVFIQQGANIWELPVLNGFSFNQATNTSEVSLNEMVDSTGVSRRGTRLFTDSYAPSEWSFDTYVRPYTASAKHRAVEEALWANFIANNSYDNATTTWTSAVTLGTTGANFDFTASNTATLGVFNIYIVMGASKVSTSGQTSYLADGDTAIYRIANASINEATVNFDIDGIATINWSGMGGRLTEVTAFDATTSYNGGIALTNNFIRNKLTQLTAVSSVSGSSKTYAITLTGGSITISNNLSYLIPDTLGQVNQPLGHITGSRVVSGSFTCYLDEKTNGSMELFEDVSNATTAITNSFALDIYIGGKVAGDAPARPGIQFKIPQAHLSLPTFDTGDVIALEVAFRALPSGIGIADEISKIAYWGP